MDTHAGAVSVTDAYLPAVVSAGAAVTVTSTANAAVVVVSSSTPIASANDVTPAAVSAGQAVTVASDAATEVVAAAGAAVVYSAQGLVGPTGATGATGDTGLRGPTGPVGPAGQARGYIWGLTLSNDATSPNTVLDIAAGECSSQNRLVMTALAFTKNCGASWAVGSGNGALDTGTFAASSTYHVFQIMRDDTYVVDYLISLSATAPTLPTSYTEFRRIGSIMTDGSVHIVKFHQIDDDFILDAPVAASYNALEGVGSQTVTLLGVPTGIVVWAQISVETETYNNQTTAFFTVQSLESTAGAGANVGVYTESGTNSAAVSPVTVRTNTSAQIRSYNNGGGAGLSNYIVITAFGWIDHRGRLS